MSLEASRTVACPNCGATFDFAADLAEHLQHAAEMRAGAEREHATSLDTKQQRRARALLRWMAAEAHRGAGR